MSDTSKSMFVLIPFDRDLYDRCKGISDSMCWSLADSVKFLVERGFLYLESPDQEVSDNE